VAARTNGSTTSSNGNATTQDSAHAPSQRRAKSGANPMLRNVLISDTTQVMMIDSNRGSTKPA